MSKLQLRIAHLYGDIMNTYGDWGNITTMIYRCRQRGIDVQLSKVSLGDELKPKQYDFYFFGGGQDSSQLIVSKDIQRLTSVIKEEVEEGAALMSVCGGYQLLGSSYHAPGQSEPMPGIGVLPVNTLPGDTRMMNNMVVALHPNVSVSRTESATLVGFENHSGRTMLDDVTMALGRVVKGHGNNGEDGTEGVVYKSAIGTYLHGSCLPKNPHLADWLLVKSLARRYGSVELEPLDDEIEWKAHRKAAG